MTITALNVTVMIICVLGATLQIITSRYEGKLCRTIRYSYAIALTLAALFVFWDEVISETEFGYGAALFVVTFNMLVGTIYRLAQLRRRPGCFLGGHCPHARNN